MVHQVQVVWGPATRLKFSFTMNVFSSQSFWCIPKAVTYSTGDKAKNLTARSFVMGGPGDMVLRDPLERSAWEETTLEGGEEATEAAGQSPPSSFLICLPSFFLSFLPILSILYEDSLMHTDDRGACVCLCVWYGERSGVCVRVCRLGVQGVCVKGVGRRPLRLQGELCSLSCFLSHSAPPDRTQD